MSSRSSLNRVDDNDPDNDESGSENEDNGVVTTAISAGNMLKVKGAKISPVYEHFLNIDGNDKKLQCKNCDKQITVRLFAVN